MTAAALQLFPITEDGRCNGHEGPWPDGTDALLDATRQLYAEQGYHPPWISYLAFVGDEMVGGGAFVGPPKALGAEIAYFTHPAREGQGLASRTAAALVATARAADPALPLWAKTLPAENASTRILQRLGFRRTGIVQDHEIGDAWR
ncbi:GNAT family protein, partial [Sandarakinorhabdus sp.]|uniref:GNAT family N-acetyltransferase n=1 Tax=Sandarakinorhabdus sp. TaxID=1916663 RepID=UPI00286D90B6